MKTLLLVWTLVSASGDYETFRKAEQSAMSVSDDSANAYLDKELVKAKDKKDAKRIVYLVALYKEWDCQLPLLARMAIEDEVKASSVDDLIKLVKEKL